MQETSVTVPTSECHCAKEDGGTVSSTVPEVRRRNPTPQKQMNRRSLVVEHHDPEAADDGDGAYERTTRPDDHPRLVGGRPRPPIQHIIEETNN